MSISRTISQDPELLKWIRTILHDGEQILASSLFNSPSIRFTDTYLQLYFKQQGIYEEFHDPHIHTICKVVWKHLTQILPPHSLEYVLRTERGQYKLVFVDTTDYTYIP